LQARRSAIFRRTRAADDRAKAREHNSDVLVLPYKGVRAGLKGFDFGILSFRCCEQKTGHAAKGGIKAYAPDDRRAIDAGRRPSTMSAAGRISAATRNPVSPVSAVNTR